jgi:serine/threonine-protein kinase
MDSRTVVSQMKEFGLWPADMTLQSAIISLEHQHRADPRTFARELMQRNLLTAYQINALFAGKGRQLVVGPYIVEERIGEGGMGQVFKARHRQTRAVVALKVIRPERIANPTAVSRHDREVQAALQMAHPNIVRAYDHGRVNGTYYLAMEFIKGVDLSSYIKHRGPLPVTQACQFLDQAAQGLQHIHEHGLIHRDIKPGNLFLEEIAGVVDSASLTKPTTSLQLRSALRAPSTAQYQIRILDLGLARLCEDDVPGESGEKQGLTQIGAVMGTADYIAPEQARDSREADIRSDIYSLGCTFYFALAGQVPFPGGTAMEKLLRHQLNEPAPLEQFRPDLPAALGAILRRMMAKQAADRFQTPAEVAAAVEPWQAGAGPPPMAIPLESAQHPTMADNAGETDEPVVVVDPHKVLSRPIGLWRLAVLVLMVGGVALVALLLFKILLRRL